MEQTTISAIYTAIISAMATGAITFLITRYNYKKNLPTEKLEIAYNRVYYPLLQLITVQSKIDQKTIHRFKTYLDKNRKYIDRSTLIAFNQLEEYPESYYVYENFKRNIQKEETYLRRRLGYLDTNIFVMYKYSDTLKKREVKLYFWFAITYMFTVVSYILVKMFPEEWYTEASMIIPFMAVLFMVYEFLSIPVIYLFREFRTWRSIRGQKKNSCGS